MKLLEESKIFSDINCTNIFLGQCPKTIVIRTKVDKWGLIKLTSLWKAKESIKIEKKRKGNLQNGRKYLQMM